jgi:hypothetical protein
MVGLQAAGRELPDLQISDQLCFFRKLRAKIQGIRDIESGQLVLGCLMAWSPRL